MKALAFVLVTLAALCCIVGTDTAVADDLCGTLGTHAEAIMEARQAGVSMQKMIEASGSIPGPAAAKEFTRSLVIKAFEHPRFSTESYKRRAIENFRDTVYLECIKLP